MSINSREIYVGLPTISCILGLAPCYYLYFFICLNVARAVGTLLQMARTDKSPFVGAFSWLMSQTPLFPN